MIPPGSGGRAKSKTNPKGICKLCTKKIFNKARNADYCKSDTETINIIRGMVSSLGGRIIRRFSYLNITFAITFQHKISKNKIKTYGRK